MVGATLILVGSASALRVLPPRRVLEEDVRLNLPNVLPVGLDEAGVGAIAGPIFVAAVHVAPDFDEKTLPHWVPDEFGKIRLRIVDSKLLNHTQRATLFHSLKDAPGVTWTTASVPASVVDENGSMGANALAMQAAVESLEQRLASLDALPPQSSGTDDGPLYALVDGELMPSGVRGRPVQGGDRTEMCIAIASIFAKVCRDQAMVSLDELHPRYGFKQNKGYASRHHMDRLAACGPCEEHRLSFSPFIQRTGRRKNTSSSRRVYERIQRKLGRTTPLQQGRGAALAGQQPPTARWGPDAPTLKTKRRRVRK